MTDATGRRVVSIMQETREALAQQKELIDSLHKEEEPHPSIDEIVEAFVQGHMGRALKGHLWPIRRQLKKQAKRDYQNQAVQSLDRNLQMTFCSRQDLALSRLLSGQELRAEALDEEGTGISVRYAEGRDPRDIPGLYIPGQARGKFLNGHAEWGRIALHSADTWTVEVISPQTGEQQVDLEIVR